MAEDFEAAEGAVRTACGLELGETAGRGAVRGRAGSLGSEFQPKLVVSFELKGFSKSPEHWLGTPGSFGFLSLFFSLVWQQPCQRGLGKAVLRRGCPQLSKNFAGGKSSQVALLRLTSVTCWSNRGLCELAFFVNE